MQLCIQLFIRRSRDISLRSPSTALQVLPLVTSMSQGKTIPALARSFRTLNKNSYPLLLIKNRIPKGTRFLIRRSRDSNPGWNRSHNDFRDRHLKPLGHFSNLLKLFKYYYFSITTLSSNWIFTLSPAFAL